MIDTKTETLRGLAEAAARLPSSRPGRRINPATVTRWVTKGVLTGGGQRVRLEAVKLGGAWVTSDEAIDRFVAATTPPHEGGAKHEPLKSAPRSQAAERVADELRKAGI